MRRACTFILLLLIQACGRELGSDIREKHNLDAALAKSIELPVRNVGYVVSMPVGLCGNSSDAELRSIFAARLYEEPYNIILKIQVPGYPFH